MQMEKNIQIIRKMFLHDMVSMTSIVISYARQACMQADTRCSVGFREVGTQTELKYVISGL